MSTVHTSAHPGEIEWYVEQFGSGIDVVLVPSGEGDCGSFARVAQDLAAGFRVTTFDTPGFSRSTASADVDISMGALADHILALLDALHIEAPIIYGCSSAGLAVLEIAANSPERVSAAVVHEAALTNAQTDDPLSGLAAMDEAEISAVCAHLFETVLNEDADAWKALGSDYHDRLVRDYVTWIRRYVGGPRRPTIEPDALAGKAITWTIGAKLEVQYFFSNVRLAHRAGIELDTLPCRHFPQVSIPEVLTEHIRRAAGAATHIVAVE